MSILGDLWNTVFGLSNAPTRIDMSQIAINQHRMEQMTAANNMKIQQQLAAMGPGSIQMLGSMNNVLHAVVPTDTCLSCHDKITWLNADVGDVLQKQCPSCGDVVARDPGAHGAHGAKRDEFDPEDKEVVQPGVVQLPGHSQLVVNVLDNQTRTYNKHAIYTNMSHDPTILKTLDQQPGYLTIESYTP